MELGLEDLVPWGRQLNEYVRIFQLTPRAPASKDPSVLSH